MATVFANDMVAHVWAQRRQSSGRSHNGNYSFEGATLYSYSTAIARFTETVSGETVALVTSRTYSPTTSSKHMPPIWRALRGDAVYYRVPNVGAVCFGGSDHAANLAFLVAAYVEAERRYRSRANMHATGDDLREAIRYGLQTAKDTATNYAAAFGLPVPAMGDADALAVEIADMREARDAARNTPEAIAKREADALKRAAAKERKEVEERRQRNLAEADKRAEWLAGGRIYYRGSTETGGAFLRVMGDNLETSQGAVVPLAEAVKVFRFVKLCKERGEGWRRNGARIEVGHFNVDMIDANGNFRAGCHRIEWPEIVSAAQSAGVFDMAASVEAVTHA